ncbi:putative LRR receptor-like serine/threonine-protein kinase [Hordeum vulgare]|nr:putative LRR receptor-like serine/threonine-protein kinase [Hordeum vulgare]
MSCPAHQAEGPIVIISSMSKVHANDDNDDYDIDDQSYAESGTQTDEHGDMSYFAGGGGVDGSNGNDEHVGDLDFDLEIGYDEYQQETLDRHWDVMAKTFRSEGEAYMFYIQYAKDRGFSIRRDLKRFGKGHNRFLFDKMLAAMQEIIANKDILNNEESCLQSFVSNDEFQPKQNHILIRDPVKVSTKGAPKQNIKGQGKNGPEVTKNGRSKAFDEKSGRLCRL